MFLADFILIIRTSHFMIFLQLRNLAKVAQFKHYAKIQGTLIKIVRTQLVKSFTVKSVHKFDRA